MTSMSYDAAGGLQSMLKSGHRHAEGIDGATLRNMEAAVALGNVVASSLGPHGRNKLVVNHLEKIIVTSDCATIVRELEIEHPAARVLSMAAAAQDHECGDGTNLAVGFAGHLLQEAAELVRTGLHVSEIVAGYRRASEVLLEDALPSMVCSTLSEINKNELERVCRPVLASKSGEHLAPLVAEACLGTLSQNKVLAENVRVTKILGGNGGAGFVVAGVVALRGAETTLSKVGGSESVKITVYGCGIEAGSTEAKGTVLMENADDLMGYHLSEEKKMEEAIAGIAATGTKLVVSGGTVSEMALHFLERYKLMCIKISSKWELRRLCTATGATALVRMGPATPDEMGVCDKAEVREVGGRPVTFIEAKQSKIRTVVLRASTHSRLQDLERAIDDGVHACRVACLDGRLVPGAGATEQMAASFLRKEGEATPGLTQYALRAAATALEKIPKTLAENSGLDPDAVLGVMNAHNLSENEQKRGVDVDAAGTGRDGTIDCSNILDLLYTKSNALRLAIDAAVTVLQVDQIIMSKPARGNVKK